MIDPSKRYLVTAEQLDNLKHKVIHAKVQSSEVLLFDELLESLNLILNEQELVEEEDLPGKVMYAYILKEGK